MPHRPIRKLALPRVGPVRKLAALAVAAVMLLLPLFYLALIGALSAATIWLPIGGFRAGLPAIAIGFLMCVGALIVLALLKPLLEPQQRTVVERPLDLGREPRLRELLDEICQSVDARPPASVHIECSTRLVLEPRRQRLIVGLPLVACLSTTELAGLLAGQLALFRRGAGCASTNFTRRINRWLWRSVYGQSRFDQWLTIVAERPHFHPAKLLLPLAAFKKVSQAVLFVPMFVANTIAAGVVRQADVDADAIAAQLIGSKTFAGLLERQELIDFSWEGVLAELDYLYRDQSLPNSLPDQLALRMLDMTPELHAALAETVTRPEDRPFDSQLTVPQRIAAATQSAPSSGLLDSSTPAASLFAAYNDLARKLTWDYYVMRFGPERLKSALQPVARPVASV